MKKILLEELKSVLVGTGALLVGVLLCRFVKTHTMTCKCILVCIALIIIAWAAGGFTRLIYESVVDTVKHILQKRKESLKG